MPVFNFRHAFQGVIWNTLAAPAESVLVLEVRNADEKQAVFHALNYRENVFLWRDRVLEEPWWVNASAISGNVVLFTIYLDTNNPDRKGVLAYALQDLSLLWWNNDFSLSEVHERWVLGVSSKFGRKELAVDLHTGAPLTASGDRDLAAAKGLKKPVQYAEGSEYFETVRRFLAEKLNLNAVSALEYLETPATFMVSFYVRESGLANYLIVVSRQGDVLLREKLDEPVSGIGVDTFFVLDNTLFFVRNKVELVSYIL